ncbi:GTPase activating protein [Schizosaccharomyces cryophilus OY26]|uniref:GTPase activating protein n=1 Tax=Schizosaccharomyces cryophilus (strain OY26 / ATCC MYA-4695 / CBS 11777 / NBRC 106824 / NRRL Y48691) TaxID=653667 RepID=S9W0L2_SCHCR|nr:GTPase activating protein [Schizosaccharomyces cryophilus OY26]EPY51954.1 GTPase activating protein [Schizosaccharomyces cryophilus OY26]
MESFESVNTNNGSSVKKNWWWGTKGKGYQVPGPSRSSSSGRRSSDEIIPDELIVLDDSSLCNVPLELPTGVSRDTASKSFSKLTREDQMLSLRLNSVQDSMFKKAPRQSTDALLDPGPVSKEKQAVLSVGRPSWLPPKSKAEEKQHLREFEQIRKAALNYDKQSQKEKFKQMERQRKKNQYLVQLWDRYIFRYWPDSLASSKVTGVWREGIPSRVRGKAWQKIIGNHLQLDYQSFFLACERARKLGYSNENEQTQNVNMFCHDRSALEVDLESTIPQLHLFQKGEALHNDLVQLVLAYSAYRYNVRYVPGTSFIGALLLLNMNLTSAFNSMVNLLDRPFMQAVYTQDKEALASFTSLFLSSLKKSLPDLANHFKYTLQAQPDQYLYPLLQKFFIPMNSVDISSRIMDCYLLEEDPFLIQVLVALFSQLKPKLLDTDFRLMQNTLFYHPWKLGEEDEFMKKVFETSIS